MGILNSANKIDKHIIFINMEVTSNVLQTLAKNPICSLEPVVGFCRAAHSRYFFDPETNECRPFIYGGCGGNDNNFPDLETCFDVCADPNTKIGDLTELGYQYFGYDYKQDPSQVEYIETIEQAYEKYLNEGCPSETGKVPNGCGSRKWPEQVDSNNDDENSSDEPSYYGEPSYY